jgi:hypothetical protein
VSKGDRRRDKFSFCFAGVGGWRASFLFTAFLSAVALIIWYVFAQAHVIHDLNTPTTSRLCASFDSFFSSWTGKASSGGSTKSRSNSITGGSSGMRSPRKKVRVMPTVGNPMLEERLL